MEKEKIITMLMELTSLNNESQFILKEIRYFLLEKFLKTDYTREEFNAVLDKMLINTDIFYLLSKMGDKK